MADADAAAPIVPQRRMPFPGGGNDRPLSMLIETPQMRMTSMKFTLFAQHEISAIGVTSVHNCVKRHIIKSNEQQVGNTAIDPRMGVEIGGPDKRAVCLLCHHPWSKCSGHMGYIPNVAGGGVFNPILFKRLKSVIECLAPGSGRFYDTVQESGLLLAYCTSRNQRDALLASIRSKPQAARLKALSHHNEVRTRGGSKLGVEWKFYPMKSLVACKEYVPDSPHPIEDTLTAKRLARLLSRLTPFDLETIGWDGGVGDLSGLVFVDLPVLPTRYRPTALREQAPAPHRYTNLYNQIARFGITEQMTNSENLDNEENIDGVRQVTGYVTKLIGKFPTQKKKTPQHTQRKQDSASVVRCMSEAVKSKRGDFRAHIEGKRVFNCARSNITPDSSLPPDTIGVPDEFAESLVVHMTVNRANRERARMYCRTQYYTEVHKMEFVREKSSQSFNDGDIIPRRLIDGDIVLFNRQPTLGIYGMIAFRIKIISGSTLRFNPTVTTSFNADFDGDEMNIWVPQSEDAMLELASISFMPRAILSVCKNSSVIGALQDTVMGIYTMTMASMVLEREQVARLVGVARTRRFPPSSLPGGVWRGIDCFAIALSGLPTTFRYTGTTFRIANGRVVPKGSAHGPVSKKDIGDGEGGMVHVIAREYGGDKAVHFLWLVTLIAVEFNHMKPLEISGEDLVLKGGKSIEPEHSTLRNSYKAACRDGDDARCDELVHDMATSALFKRVKFALDGYRELDKQLTNAFTAMVYSKSKGKATNLFQQFGAVGVQTALDGAKMPAACGGRTMPHFPLNADDPAVKGLVTAALADGLNPIDLYQHMWASRSGLIYAKLKTPDTGYAQRRIMQNFRSCVVGFDGVVRSEGRIVQFAYGCDNAAPELTVTCSIGVDDLERAQAEGCPAAAVKLVRDAAEAGMQEPAENDGKYKIVLPIGIDRVLENWGRDGGLPAGAEPATWDHVLAMGVVLRPFTQAALTVAAIQVKMRPSALTRAGIGASDMPALHEALRKEWERSRIAGGTAVGMLVGMSICPDWTQKMLNAFHRSGMHGVSQDDTTALNALLNVSKDKFDITGMFIFLDPLLRNGSSSQGEVEARTLAASITAVTLQKLMRGKPLVGPGAHAPWIADAVLSNSAAPHVPSRQIAFPLSASKLQEYHTTPARVASALAAFTHRRVVVCPRSLSVCIELVPADSEKMTILNKAKNALLSGFPNIVKASAFRRTNGEWMVQTVGSNLRKVLAMDEVDPERTYSRHIPDICRTLGALAAREAVYRELKRMLDTTYVNQRHLYLFADYMLRMGTPLGLNRFGMEAGKVSPIARMIFECSVTVAESSAIIGEVDNLTSITAQVFAGNFPRIGTGASDVILDVASSRDAARSRKEEERRTKLPHGTFGVEAFR